MRRIVVIGGLGFFGDLAIQRLRADGCQPLSAARRAGAELRLDAEDPASLRDALRPGDVLLDTVGPFQDRSLALLDAALEIGCDLVDISDSRGYVEKVYSREAAITASGRRVLTACSSISAISAAMTRRSGLPNPVRMTGFLTPAVRYAANPGSGGSLLRSVGLPVGVLRDGRPATRLGWRDTRPFTMPPPIGTIYGHLYETADPLTLPRVWPSLRDVSFYVDTRVPGLNAAFSLAARSRLVWQLFKTFLRPGLAVARAIGPDIGCLAFEIEGADGRQARLALVGGERGHFTPIAPAVLAVRALAEDRFEPPGLVPADEYVDGEELVAYLRALGVETVRLE
ncbi:MAG: hypothetical protein ABI847_01515 [Anaerolineales bacterium]